MSASVVQIKCHWQFTPTLEGGCVPPSDGRNMQQRPLRLVEGERMADVQDRWLCVEEICQHFGVSSDTVYRWIDRSAMPEHMMGRKWKFKRDQVDACVEAGSAASDACEGGAK